MSESEMESKAAAAERENTEDVDYDASAEHEREREAALRYAPTDDEEVEDSVAQGAPDDGIEGEE